METKTASENADRTMPDRMTARLNVYHERFAEQPTGLDIQFQNLLEFSGDSYARSLVVGSEWVGVADDCWVKNAGFVIVENTTAVNPMVVSSEAEEKEVASRVVQITSDLVPEWIVRPGTFFMGEVVDLRSLLFRCTAGDAKIKLWVFPR